MTLALLDRVRRLSRSARAELYEQLREIGPGSIATRRYDWEGFCARPDQLVPIDEAAGLVIFAGPRGVGKTSAALNLWLREILAGRAWRPRLVVAKEADVGGVIVNGESGINYWLPEHLRPEWISSSKEAPAGELRFHSVGVTAYCFTASSHESTTAYAGDWDFYDDVAKWGPHAEAAWRHARLSCRVGRGQGIVATTRRGTTLLRRLLAGSTELVKVYRPPDPTANDRNLSANYRAQRAAEDDGSDFLRQELDDEDISTTSPFEGLRFAESPIRIEIPSRDELDEIVISVDPSEGKGGDHDDWGIGATGTRRRDKHIIVLEDRTGQYDDAEAADRILALCDKWDTTTVVAESNKGPRVVSSIKAAFYKRRCEVLRVNPGAKVRPEPTIITVTARDKKRIRAGPVAKLYRDGLMHHTPGLVKLERQQREWDPDGPRRPRVDDAIDQVVIAAHYLADLGGKEKPDPGVAARAAAVGLREANLEMPAPAWTGDLV